MTTVYRAYSPSRDDHGEVHADEDRAAGDASILNQAARAFSSADDWRIQTGTVTWEES